MAVLANHPIFILLKLKCCSMTADVKLHCSACCCDLQMSETISAQLQQQLAHLKQELSQAQRSKHEATKVNLVWCIHHD